MTEFSQGRRAFLGAACAAALGASTMGSTAVAAQSGHAWPSYRNGSNRSGYAPDGVTIEESFEPEWNRGESNVPLVALAHDTVYVRGDRLVALSRSGETKWEVSSGQPGGMVAAGNRLYATFGSTVRAFDTRGNEQWSTSLDRNRVYLAALNGTLYVAATDNETPTGRHDGTVYALDRETGSIERSRSIPNLGWYVCAASAPAETVYVTQFVDDEDRTAIRALDAATLETDWTWYNRGGPALLTPPAIGHGLCYVSTSDSLVALDAESGDEAWSLPLGQRPVQPVLGPETLYVSVDRQLVAIDPASGNPEWQTETPGAGVVGAGDTLYTMGEEGLFAVDRSTGEILAEYRERPARRVVPGSEQLYVSNRSGVYALSSSGGTIGGGGGEIDHEVTVGPQGEFVFEPTELRVEPGETVRWTWESDNHTLTPQTQPAGGDWQGNPQVEGDGYVYEHTFDAEGVYEYVCEPHAALGMEGTVVVGDGASRDAGDGTSNDGSGTDETTGGGSGDTTDGGAEDGTADDETGGDADTESTDEPSAGDANGTADNESFADAFGDLNESDAESADGTPGPGILGALGGLGATAGWLAR
ncbi:PQQ-binding-like beta-propeller repeat protein, partial [Natronoarchaeum mannanilyticum]